MHVPTFRLHSKKHFKLDNGNLRQIANRAVGMQTLTFRQGDRPLGSWLAAENSIVGIMHSELVVERCIHGVLALALRIIAPSA